MATSTDRPRLTNVLSKAKSPYLLQHQDNPVAWQEWKPETIKMAQDYQIPIFLSIGYSACHWCHVLAHQSFEDESIAEIMNKHYINIKVDREELPAVDRVYMNYLQATQGGGGWPLSVWLTPELEPVYAGTYYPKNQFRSILMKIAELWEEDRDRLKETGKRVMDQLKGLQESDEVSGTSLSSLAATASHKIYAYLSKRYDPVHGGFSKSGPKFPSPAQTTTPLARIARYGARSKSETEREKGAKAAEMGVRQLRALWEGGIRDWVGNGLARYSVDEKWRIPHFEKMLYDQGQVASAALDFAGLPNLPSEESRKLCLDLAADILEYTARDLRSPDGGFYSAEDADSAETFEDLKHTVEGAFYVWDKEEFDEVLEEDAAVTGDFFGVKVDGNVDPRHDAQGELTGKNTLFQAKTVEEIATKHGISADQVRQIIKGSLPKLKEHRDATRPRPHLDDKIVAGWNGLMISALAQASYSLPADTYPIAKRALELAEGAVAFIKKEMYDEEHGVLSRTWREGKGPAGQADDYAFLTKGLLDLYEATGKEKYLTFALTLQDRLDQLFWDTHSGGYFASAPDPHILIRLKDSQDGAEPSASAVAVQNLQRLAFYASQRYEEFWERSGKIYSLNGEMLENAPHAFGATAAALMDREAGYREFIITGKSDDPFVLALLGDLSHCYSPNKILIRLEPKRPPAVHGAINPTVDDLVKHMQSDERPNLRVCENMACHPPVYDVEEAKKIVKS